MRRQERKRDTRVVHLGDGFKLDSVLPADEGELLLNVLHQAAGDASAETPLGDRLTDALMTLADHWTATHPTSSAAMPSLQVSVDLEALRGERHWAPIAGRPIPAETARRLACDAKISRLLTDARSEPLAVGRETRVVPAGLRRALHARDGGCTFPGCGRRHHLDAHHVIHWVYDGDTALWNLVLLCRRHHRIVHEGEWNLVMTDDGPASSTRSADTITPNVSTDGRTPPAMSRSSAQFGAALWGGATSWRAGDENRTRIISLEG